MTGCYSRLMILCKKQGLRRTGWKTRAVAGRLVRRPGFGHQLYQASDLLFLGLSFPIWSQGVCGFRGDALDAITSNV